MQASKYMITARSSNKKTGPMMVTTSSRDTCPKVCALRNNGCYADAGPLRRLWNNVTATNIGETFKNGVSGSIPVVGLDALLTAIRKQFRTLWRHNQAGDLHGDGMTIDAATLAAIADANKACEGRGFTYTHYPVLGSAPHAVNNRAAIADANAKGFTVNLSGNNLAHADKLAALNIGPVVALVSSDTTSDTTTPSGRKVKVCPATQSDDVDCMRCGMCQAARDFIIAFPAHGTGTKKANAVAA